MDSSSDYIIIIINGDVWVSGSFGDDMFFNMKRIPVELDGEQVDAIDVSIISKYEFRVLLEDKILVSVKYGKSIEVIGDDAIEIAGNAYLTDRNEVVIGDQVIRSRVDKIFRDYVVVGRRIYQRTSKVPSLVHIVGVEYVVDGFNELLYVDSNRRLFSNGSELLGTHNTYGVDKVLPFGYSERVVLDMKGIIHFLGTSSNKALGLNSQLNSNVIEAPFVAINIGVYTPSPQLKLIVAIDQTNRLWSITASNPERIGWHPISEVNRYYHPSDPYPVTFV